MQFTSECKGGQSNTEAFFLLKYCRLLQMRLLIVRWNVFILVN